MNCTPKMPQRKQTRIYLRLPSRNPDLERNEAEECGSRSRRIVGKGKGFLAELRMSL